MAYLSPLESKMSLALCPRRLPKEKKTKHLGLDVGFAKIKGDERKRRGGKKRVFICGLWA